MNNPWLCPRCSRMNAPFNPICFCKPKEESTLEKALNDPKAQQQYPFTPNYKNEAEIE